MGNSYKDLIKQAQSKAMEIRRKQKLDLKSPICIYDVCQELELTIQFVPLAGLEGMYLNEEEGQRILVSSLRPLPRQVFTCAHELGHHLFEHGLKFDEMEKVSLIKQRDPKEFLVDCFAGFLLMPKIAVYNAFTLRAWTPATASPKQIFTIACSFGVGYSTLIDHMTYSLQMLSESKSRELKKFTPKKIRQLIEVGDSSPLVIADEQWLLKTVDVEVGCQLLLPKTAKIDSNKISFQENHEAGKLFIACQPGLIRAYCPDSNWSVFIRIARSEYVGYSQYRYLEECDDE